MSGNRGLGEILAFRGERFSLLASKNRSLRGLQTVPFPQESRISPKPKSDFLSVGEESHLILKSLTTTHNPENSYQRSILAERIQAPLLIRTIEVLVILTIAHNPSYTKLKSNKVYENSLT
ncbi:hypothetical protein [Lentibacillus sp. Marseille-P4043]|uniref:hypothetical protein n=1 Tax=Lentibacillus sp. Marseille-P4043 TaxID=2040293 RepID=UPI00131A4BF3|nr:hypothetical protein [Lentibacillus sp. Marseille-P4043]